MHVAARGVADVGDLPNASVAGVNQHDVAAVPFQFAGDPVRVVGPEMIVVADLAGGVQDAGMSALGNGYQRQALVTAEQVADKGAVGREARGAAGFQGPVLVAFQVEPDDFLLESLVRAHQGAAAGALDRVLARWHQTGSFPSSAAAMRARRGEDMTGAE